MKSYLELFPYFFNKYNYSNETVKSNVARQNLIRDSPYKTMKSRQKQRRKRETASFPHDYPSSTSTADTPVKSSLLIK